MSSSVILCLVSEDRTSSDILFVRVLSFLEFHINEFGDILLCVWFLSPHNVSKICVCCVYICFFLPSLIIFMALGFKGTRSSVQDVVKDTEPTSNFQVHMKSLILSRKSIPFLAKNCIGFFRR